MLDNFTVSKIKKKKQQTTRMHVLLVPVKDSTSSQRTFLNIYFYLCVCVGVGVRVGVGAGVSKLVILLPPLPPRH